MMMMMTTTTTKATSSTTAELQEMVTRRTTSASVPAAWEAEAALAATAAPVRMSLALLPPRISTWESSRTTGECLGVVYLFSGGFSCLLGKLSCVR